jgi:hypothetical protein
MAIGDLAPMIPSLPFKLDGQKYYVMFYDNKIESGVIPYSQMREKIKVNLISKKKDEYTKKLYEKIK